MSNPYDRFEPELLRSRGLLLQVLKQLSGQTEAITVVGAHAVFERTRHLTKSPQMDSTHDADLSVIPELLVDVPLLAETLRDLELEPASPSRPGVWGLIAEHDLPFRNRLTIDLLAPASLSGKGTRSADVGVHGKHSVSRTEGMELALIDRFWMTIDSFDGGESQDAYVAGHAALVCAKVYKIFDRLDPKELARNPQRYRPKDVTDLWRLMATSDGADVRDVFDKGEANSKISAAVIEGRRRLLDLHRRDDGNWITGQVLDQWEGRFPAARVKSVVNDWMSAFGS